MRSKILRRIVSALVITGFLLVNAVSHAEIYTGEGSYVMSEGENLGVSKERAKADAMRNASEKAGVYVRSYARSRNFELEEEIIETMTANIIKLVENPHFYPLEEVDNLEGVLIRVTVKVQIDDSDINRWLNKDEQQKSELVAQMEALRKANAEQERQIAELKRQLANNPQDKERITQKFENEDKIFLSNQKVEEATRFLDNGKYEDAIKLCNEALELNSDNELAYLRRGNAYYGLKQNERAIQDFNKALEFKQHEFMYTSRGNAYGNLGQYERAIQDYNKALQLNPNLADAYYNRGNVYARLGNFKQAIADVTKAIELNPNFAMAYHLRGLCYQELGDEEKVQADFAKAKQLGYNG
ncbi:MAG: tetratricopeptide repeat protein [Quinella sp. 3Q1]|nr:tetratricopeptide repeat protein [Quinella sp. 3Q1]MBR6887819.1 tetratricopeptide repeat protein [Selenomonadaceae bacterium]